MTLYAHTYIHTHSQTHTHTSYLSCTGASSTTALALGAYAVFCTPLLAAEVDADACSVGAGSLNIM
jgi:hypothetical protein